MMPFPFSLGPDSPLLAALSSSLCALSSHPLRLGASAVDVSPGSLASFSFPLSRLLFAFLFPPLRLGASAVDVS